MALTSLPFHATVDWTTQHIAEDLVDSFMRESRCGRAQPQLVVISSQMQLACIEYLVLLSSALRYFYLQNLQTYKNTQRKM